MLLTFQLFAAENNPAPSTPGPTEETKVNSNKLSSEENRKNLNYQFTVSLLGAEYSSASATALSAGVFLSPEDLLSLRYAFINKTSDNEVEKMRSLTLGFRHFLGNSFNLMPTIFWRRTTINNDSYNPSSWLTGTRHFVYEDVGIGLRLGNEWQWKRFTMGCDWIGVNKSIKVLNEATNDRGVLSTSETQESITVTLLSFYLGYSF